MSLSFFSLPRCSAAAAHSKRGNKHPWLVNGRKVAEQVRALAPKVAAFSRKSWIVKFFGVLALSTGPGYGASITGTPTEIVWAAGADPAGQSVTVPVGATSCFMFWSFYYNGDGEGLSAVTLDSGAPDQTFEVVTAPDDENTAGLAAWHNPGSGSVTLDPAWDQTPGEGPLTIFACVTDGATSAWRDADGANEDLSTAVSATIDSVSGDLVLKFDQHFSAGGTAPSTSGGWSSVQTAANNNEAGRLSSITASGATTTCDSEDEDYSSVVCVSIPDAAGGASVVPKILQQMTKNGELSVKDTALAATLLATSQVKTRREMLGVLAVYGLPLKG